MPKMLTLQKYVEIKIKIDAIHVSGCSTEDAGGPVKEGSSHHQGLGVTGPKQCTQLILSAKFCDNNNSVEECCLVSVSPRAQPPRE